jgi:hypothetical protein
VPNVEIARKDPMAKKVEKYSFFFLTDYKTVPTIGITLFIRITRTMRSVRLKDSVSALIALVVFLCIATRSREWATL